jgi:hypothetical protein
MQMAIFRGAIWTAAEGLSPIRIHSVRYADQFPGGDCGAKINAADADLASSPGEIWVNNNCGLAWITPVSISSGHVLRFIQGNTSTVYTLSCANPSLGCSTAGITLAANSSMVGPPIAMATNTTPVIELQMATTTPATNLPAIISVNGSFAAIRDIEIDGNSASNGSSGPNIVLNGAQRVDIDHVTSGKSNSDGVKLVGTSSSAKISRLMTYQNKGNGLNCTGQSGDLIVSLSEFEANTGWGAVLFDCAGVRITGSDFGGNTAGGLLDESDGTANGGSNLILEATQFGNNTGDDLLVEGSTSSFGTYQDAIVGNVFIGSSSRSNSGSAIHLVGGGQHIVTGNSIQSANDNKNAYGILMADNSSSAAASVVCDNQFVGSFGTAFYSNSQANASGCASGGGFTNMGAVNILMSPDTPSISPSSGFNTGSISSSASNGTTSFQITIGTGTANNNGTLLFKVAAHGWNCPSLTDITHAAGNLPRQSGVGTTTTVPITNYNNSGTPINWTNNDTIEATCYAY